MAKKSRSSANSAPIKMIGSDAPIPPNKSSGLAVGGKKVTGTGGGKRVTKVKSNNGISGVMRNPV